MTPAMVLSSSPARWLLAPLPAEPKVISPGLSLAMAISCLRSLMGEFAAVTMISGTVVTRITGAKSLTES
ncbi:hypothetical protein D3C72_1929330 [compost metagenome]